jgi:hypothetical protein
MRGSDRNKRSLTISIVCADRIVDCHQESAVICADSS